LLLLFEQLQQQQQLQVSKIIRQETASPCCHPSCWRMHSPVACSGQAYSSFVGMSPSKMSLAVGIWTHVNQQSAPKQHLDWSAVFAQLTRMPNTYTQTHKPRYVDICSNRPHLHTACFGTQLRGKIPLFWRYPNSL